MIGWLGLGGACLGLLLPRAPLPHRSRCAGPVVALADLSEHPVLGQVVEAAERAVSDSTGSSGVDHA